MPFRRETFGGIAYDPASEDYYFLNESAFAVLDFLDTQALDEPSLDRLPESVQNSIRELGELGLTHVTATQESMLRGHLTHADERILSAPTTIEIYPTFLCNERCQFCYVGSQVERASAANMIPPHRIPLLASRIADAGVFNVTILGGEPFLYPSLDLLIEQLASKNLDVSLSTNGTVQNDRLLKAAREHGVKLNVALHAHEEFIHDRITRSTGFSNTIQTLHEAIGAGIPVHVTLVLHASNLALVEDFVAFLARMGVGAATVSYSQPASYARHNKAVIAFEEYESAFRRAFWKGRELGLKVQGNCHYNFLLKEYETGFDTENPLARYLYGDKAGRSRLEMTPNGDLYPTSSVFDQPGWKVGNLFSDDLYELWISSAALQRIRERTLPGICAECSHRGVCGGGIVGELITCDGWNSPPSDCPIVRQLNAAGAAGPATTS